MVVTNIQPPNKPIEPEYESEDLPDQKHQWKKQEDGSIDIFAFEYGDYHNGPCCELCEFGDCQHCNSKVWDDMSCLREQAKNRNADRRAEYKAALKKYEAQMEYYEQLKDAA